MFDFQEKTSILNLKNKLAELEQKLQDQNEIIEEFQKKISEVSDFKYADGIASWEYDIASNVGNCSPGLYKLHGLEPEPHFNPEKFISLIIPDDQKNAEETIRALINNPDQTTTSFTYRIIKNSDIRRILTKAQIITDGEGKIYQIFGTSQDITDIAGFFNKTINYTEKIISASEFNTEYVCINKLGDGSFVDVNHRCCRLFGISRAKIIGKNISELDLSFEVENLEALKTLLKNQRQIERFIVKFISKNGKIYWLSTSCKIIILENVEHILFNSIEITEAEKNVPKSDYSDILFDENEGRFEEILNNVPFAYSRVNKTGRWEYANKKWLQMYNISYTELKGKYYDYIFPNYAKEQELNHLNDALAGKIVTGESSRINQDKVVYFSYHLIPIIKKEEIIGVDLYHLDISKTKVAEESLKASREKYRIIRENIPVIVYSLIPGRETAGIFISGRVEELTGYNYLEFYSDVSLWQKLQYENDKNYYKLKVEEHRRNKTQLNIEYRIKTKTNEIKWVRDVATPLLDEKFEIERINGFLEDISERKNAEKALKMSEVKFRSLFEDSKDCIYITSSHGQIVDINPAGLDLFGYTKEEMLKMNATLLYEDIADRIQFQKILEEHGYVKDYLVYLKRKSGEIRTCLLTTSASRNDKSEIRGYQGIVRDITESKKAEIELIEAKEKAEKADRLKTEFLAQMSHEIRTPVNTILSFTSLIKSEFSEKVAGELPEYFAILDRAGKRIIRTIDLVLNMAEIQTGSFSPKLEQMDITSILMDLYSEYKAIAKDKGLNLKLNVPKNNVNIIADEYSTTQILANLIDNAIKYTLLGEINLSVDAESDEVKLNISDTGIGISKEYLPDLFSTFTQEEQGYTRKFEGSGLGLALVKHYCKLNKAEILVESKKGEGTIFTVVFKKYPCSTDC